MKIAVLNNNLGNIQSILNILDHLNVNYIFTNKKKKSQGVTQSYFQVLDLFQRQ